MPRPSAARGASFLGSTARAPARRGIGVVAIAARHYAAPVTRSPVALGSVALSVLLAVGLYAAHRLYGSELALAQAADSLADVFTASALHYSMRVAATPPDENHPHGHHRAEPIAALLAAVMAGVLATEVLRSAVGTLLGEPRVELALPLALAFVAKILGKLGIAAWATVELRRGPSPALSALRVDARNDVAFSALALAGFVAGRSGGAAWDALLAVPVGAWIGISGVLVGRESIAVLMGESAPPERTAEIRAVIAALPGVLDAHEVTVRQDGSGLDVAAHVTVDAALSLRAAHDLATAVERRLGEEPDVVRATVHVDPSA